MTIEQEAARDLALDSDQAENVVGGKKNVKAKGKATRHTAQKTYPVNFIQVPASTGGPIDDSGTTAWSEDCADPSAADTTG